MSIGKWMDKEVVVHVCNGILLNQRKECIWVSSSEVDEPGICYAEWSKSEREKQILYVNTCIWNLEKQYWWTYLHSSYGDTDIQNRLVDTAEEAEGGTNRESSCETSALPYAKDTASGDLL